VTKAAGAGDEYAGLLSSEPDHDIGHKFRDPVRVKRAQIVDWIVQGEGPAQGNYTLKALFPKMKPEEIAEAKKAMGWE
jgi:uncharacterized protein YegJ (DUF2314 family)